LSLKYPINAGTVMKRVKEEEDTIMEFQVFNF